MLEAGFEARHLSDFKARTRCAFYHIQYVLLCPLSDPSLPTVHCFLPVWGQASGVSEKDGFTQIPETVLASGGLRAFPVFVPPKDGVVTRCVEQIQRTSRPLCLALSVSLRPWAPLQGGVPVYGAKEFWVISRQRGGRLEDCRGFVRRWGEGRGGSQRGQGYFTERKRVMFVLQKGWISLGSNVKVLILLIFSR